MSDVAALLAAIGIGLLIGLERGWRQRHEHAGGRIAGIRTHALLALGGGLCGLLAAHVSVWFGLAGVAGLIAAVVLAQEGAEPVGNRPEEFGRMIREETVKWAKVIKAANITAD